MRKNHRSVRKSRFVTIPNMEVLASRLFDPSPSGTATPPASTKTDAKEVR